MPGGPSHVILRIGINLGDVIVDGSDLYGDGVNIAARLEELAEPGGICISGSCHDQVSSKVTAAFDDIGAQALKNIAEPVRAYRVRRGVGQPRTARDGIVPLPDKPSIAVLPFTNMSGDPEQESFADGIDRGPDHRPVAELRLFVIARNSAFAYKGTAVDVRRDRRDLGVRYLLEGSVRRAGDRVRINAQLVDARSGDHLWAERFDRGLEDIFAVQDEVTGKIVEALLGRLRAPPPRNRPRNLEAYDLCVRARKLMDDIAAGGAGSASAAHARDFARSRICGGPSLACLDHWMGWVALGRDRRNLAVSAALELAQQGRGDRSQRCRLPLGLWPYCLPMKAQLRRGGCGIRQGDRARPERGRYLGALSGHRGSRPGGSRRAIETFASAFRLNPFPRQAGTIELGQAQYAAARIREPPSRPCAGT